MAPRGRVAAAAAGVAGKTEALTTMGPETAAAAAGVEAVRELPEAAERPEVLQSGYFYIIRPVCDSSKTR